MAPVSDFDPEFVAALAQRAKQSGNTRLMDQFFDDVATIDREDAGAEKGEAKINKKK